MTSDGRVIVRGSPYAIHVWRSGEPLGVLLASGAFPNQPPRTLCGLFQVAANPSGAVAFHAEEKDDAATGCYERAAYGPADDDAVTLVARSGELVSGAEDFAHVGFYFTYKPSIAIDASGRVAFFASLDDTTTPTTSLTTALFGPDAGGVPALIARVGAPAFGDPGARDWKDLLDFRLNDAGQVAFSGRLARSPFGIYAPTALQRHTPGGDPVVVAQTGEPAPGVAGAVFQALGGFDLDASGRVAFDALLDPAVGDVTLFDDHGIWVTDPDGSATLVHREGDPVPDAAGAVFGLSPGLFPFGAPRINGAGELAFSAWMLDAGVEVAGIWGPDPLGAPSLRVRGGDPAAGLADATFAWFELLAFNDEREILFVAHLSGANVDASNDRAWYFADAAGALTLLLREGDLLERTPGNPRPVGEVDARIGADPTFSRIAVLLTFDDEYSYVPSAIYSTTVPEPAGAAVAWLALAWLARRVRASRRALGLLLVAALATTPFAASAVTWWPVARSGEPAPGFPTAHLEGFVVAPALSGTGQVVFRASTRSWEEPSEILYVWTAADGASIVATAGSDEAGFDLGGLHSVRANDAGEIAFAASRSLRCLYCPNLPELLVGPAPVGDLAVTAQSGDPAIGGPAGSVLRGGFAGDPVGLPFGPISWVNQPVINDAAQMVTRAQIGEAELAPGVPEYEYGVWNEALYFFDPQTGPALVARAGDAAPGFPEGTLFEDFDTQTLGGGGVVAFRAFTEAGPNPVSVHAYRWSAAAGLELIVRGGDALPGDPERTLLGTFPPAIVDAAGNVALLAVSTGTGSSVYHSAIWLVDTAGATTELVPFEAPAPGLPDGSFFTYISHFARADDGTVVFAASAELPDATSTGGIWMRGADGGIRKLFVDGDPAPGIPAATFDTAVIADLHSMRIFGFQILGLSPSGVVAFAGGLTGAGVDDGNSQAHYRLDPDGRVRLLVRRGDPFEVAPGDVRPVDIVRLTFDRDLDFAAVTLASGDASAVYFSVVPEADAELLGGVAIAVLAGFVRLKRRSAD